jgi:hemolysin D
VFCPGLIWPVSHVDIVATATGKVVPNGRVKLIQPFDIGVVRAIEIRDGRASRPRCLIELDPPLHAGRKTHQERPHGRRPDAPGCGPV